MNNNTNTNENKKYENLTKAIEEIMIFMKNEYPNNFEMILTKDYAQIKSTLPVTTFINQPEENKDTENTENSEDDTTPVEVTE